MLEPIVSDMRDLENGFVAFDAHTNREVGVLQRRGADSTYLSKWIN